MKVFLLQDDLYDTTLSLHATRAGAVKALEDHINGETVENARSWWERFGRDSEFAARTRRFPKALTFADHLAAEQAVVRQNLRIQEWEVKR